jgi:glycosyltransferase involved in cell wall biosynthesis
MRILIVSQYFWPENFRINDLAAELVARGNEVTVLTGTPNYPDGRVFTEFSRNPGAFSRFAGVAIERIPFLPRGRSGMRLALNYLVYVLSGLTFGLWRLRGRAFDAIFVYQVSPITQALPALALRRLKKAPLFIWVLDLWPETLLAVGVLRSPRLLGWIGRLVAFVYRRCDRILVQSRGFIDNVVRYGGDRDRIRYFPGWAEPLFAGKPEDVAPAPEFAPFRDTFNVLFAGNIGDAQDFPAILDAAAVLRNRADIRLLVAGDGRAVPYVRSEIASRGLEDRVVLLGRFPIERMPSFFRAADALLVSLRKEPVFSLTIPSKVQSYLGAGKPILGMLDGEGARVIDEAGAGLVVPAGDGVGLAARISELVAMPHNERQAMGTRGRAYCRREFDRVTLIDNFEGWMKELASR